MLPYQSNHIDCTVQFSSVAQSCPTLWQHEPQHTRPPCPSPTSGVYPNSCPLSWWCHPTILSSVVSFSSCPQSFPASGSFLMSRLFISGSQSIGASSSASVLPMRTQGWFPLGHSYRLKLRRSSAQSSSCLFSYSDSQGGPTRGWHRCQSSLDCQAIACGQTPERVIQPTVDFLSEKQTFVILSHCDLGAVFPCNITL